MRVERQLIMKADRHFVRSRRRNSDPDSYPTFMPNLERWDTVTEGPAEIGSRYIVHWKIGAAPVGGVIELVEFDPARDLAWLSITGVSVRGRFRLRDAGRAARRSRSGCPTSPLADLFGLLADRLASRQVGHTLAASLDNLRALVES